jgi:hypothetical protein
MAPVSVLPDELVAEIYKRVTACGVPSKLDVQRMMRVCKQWHRIGAPLYFKEVLVMTGYHSIAQCGWEYHGSPGYLNAIRRFHFEHIQSLTVECEIKTPDNRFKWDMSSTVAAMKNLKTFSLRARHPNPCFNINRQHLTNVIKALPRSLRNLEIDTLCNDRGSPEGDLCLAIRVLLPRLVHLRLNLFYICGQLFGVPFVQHPNLRSLVIAQNDPFTREPAQPREDGRACCGAYLLTAGIMYQVLDMNFFPNLKEVVWYETVTRSESKAMGLALIGGKKGVHKGYRTNQYPRYILGFAHQYPTGRMTGRNPLAPVLTQASMWHADDAGLHCQPERLGTPAHSAIRLINDTRATPEGDSRWRTSVHSGLRCPPGVLCNIPRKWDGKPGIITSGQLH